MAHAEADAPCTVGNFGPGFDVFSLALQRRGDRVRLSTADADEVRVTGVGASRIPPEWARNAACAAIDHLRAATGHEGALLVELEKGAPPASGLGSSASSCAAAVRAFARLHGMTLPAALALDAAAAGEKVASGGAHRDDVAAALVGGLVIVGGEGQDAIVRLRPPPVHIIVARPDVELRTRDMRGLIPHALPKEDVVRNLSGVARVVHACHAQDAELLCRALDDRISRPYRASRVPGFDAMRDAARQAGARAFILSGSGPSVIAVTPKEFDANPIASAMRDAMQGPGEVFVTEPQGEVTDDALRLR